LDTNFWGFFMTKYTEQFKLQVVQDYLGAGSAGLRAVAQRYGIPSHFTVRKWVLAFQLHGNVGLGQDRQRRQHSAEFKLSVLRHMWDNQLSMLQTAVKFDIRDHGMVGRWEHAYQEGGVEALAPRPRGKPKPMATSVPTRDSPPDDDKRSREELLAEVNQLRMEVAYLKKLEALVQARPKQALKKKRK
jgi:transposase